MGPEVVLKAVSAPRVRRISRPVVIGDIRILEHLASKLKLPAPKRDGVISLSDLDPIRLKPGRPTRACARAMTAYIEEAVCMAREGDVDAIVTAPISKEAIKKAGFKYPGHTEFLAHLTGAKDFAMMLGGSRLKVVLVTIHEQLRRVPRLVTGERVLRTIRITHASFRRHFGLRRPRIAVAGLNPHAGEAGIFGDEEKRVIAPAVGRAKRQGIDATGPLPPDTVFYRAVNGEFDCVVCMYHDQGLGPLKLLHFDDGVNVTLGLPIIRTSVDHGTAYDIAWKGKASPKSMIAAIEMAVGMAKRAPRRTGHHGAAAFE